MAELYNWNYGYIIGCILPPMTHLYLKPGTGNHKTLIEVTPRTTRNYKHNFSIKDKIWTTITNSNYIFIFGVVMYHKLNISYPYDIKINIFYWTGCLIRVDVEPGDWYDLLGVNPIVNINGFYKYTMHIMRWPNIDTGKPELMTKHLLADQSWIWFLRNTKTRLISYLVINLVI